MTVVIENDPSWLDYLIAIGTVGAAAFAVYAALVSRRAAAAAIDLVRVESGRDTRAADEAMWRQARRVAVDMRATPVPHPSPHELVVERLRRAAALERSRGLIASSARSASALEEPP